MLTLKILKIIINAGSILFQMTIKWGKYQFQGPSKYDRGIVKDAGGGVYVIMIISGHDNGSPLYKVIYFGQTDNFAGRLTTSHSKYSCFTKQSKELYRGLNFMTDSTEEQRKKVESELIKQYKPVCNDAIP